MIARTWRGATRADDADTYLAYLGRTGIAEYRATPGNVAVLALRRDVGDRTEFLLVTLWDSEESVRAFAGEPMDEAVFYAEDERFLVDFDTQVHHYDVAFVTGNRHALDPTGPYEADR